MNKKILKFKAWSKIFTRLALKPWKLNTKLSDFNLLSDRETIQFLKKKQIGIVRYGNSELSFLAGYSIRHQNHNKELEKKIINILLNYNKNFQKNNYLIALPLDIIMGNNERGGTKKVWRGAPTYAPLPFLKKRHTYGSPFCFRITGGLLEDNKEEYIKMVLELINNKNVIYVGPSKEEAREIITIKRFIKIPPKNVFENYDNLIKIITKEAKNINNPLVLVTAGITATALSADLNDRGILTYDVGQMFRYFK